jgi:hypothetical protein
MTEAATAVVRRQITVQAPIEHAVAVFTERFGDFKPAEHNLLATPIAETVFEPRAGGHIYDAHRRQCVPLGSGAGLRTTTAGRVQLGHRPHLADRKRPGQQQRGRGSVHSRSTPIAPEWSWNTAT